MSNGEGATEDPFINQDVDDPDSSEEEEQDEDADSEEKAFEDTVAAAADDLEKLSSVELTSALVDVVMSAGATAAQNPMEGVRDMTTPSPRLDHFESRRDTAFGKIPDVVVRDASATFLDAVFKVELDGTTAERRDAASGLLTHLVFAAQGKPQPETLQSSSAETVTKTLASFKDLSDQAFWSRLADYFQGELVPLNKLGEHFALMGFAGQMSPLERPFLWANANGVAWQVDQLIAASGSDPLGASAPLGRPAEVAEIYRRAATLAAGGQPIPRAVVSELVRLALGDLAAGVQPSSRYVLEPGREAVLRSMAPEDVPQGATAADRAAIGDRNAARSAATDLVKSTGENVAKRRTLTPQNVYRDVARAGRQELGEVWSYQADDLLNSIRRMKGGKSVAKAVEKIVRRSGIEDALSDWSTMYRTLDGTPADFANKMARLKQLTDQLTAALEPFGTNMNDATRVMAQGLLPIVGALNVEIAFEANELMGGGSIDVGSRLGGAITSTEYASLPGRWRAAAEIARDSVHGLGDLTLTVPKAYTKSQWCVDLKAAADIWTKGDQSDLTELAKATQSFTTSLETIRSNLGALDPQELYFAKLGLDAAAWAVADRLQEIVDTGDPDALTNFFPQLATELAKNFRSFDNVQDLVGAWNAAKGAVSGKVPGGKDLQTKLKAWQNIAYSTNPDSGALAQATYPVVDAIADYRVRIEQGKHTPADKAKLLNALDLLLANISAGLETANDS